MKNIINAFFKDVVVHYEMTTPDGNVSKGTDTMKIWGLVKWLTWMSPPSWAPLAVNNGIKTVITRLSYVN